MHRRDVLKGIGSVFGIGGIAAISNAASRYSGKGDRAKEAGGDGRLVGEVETPGARELDVKGNYAFVGNGELAKGDDLGDVDGDGENDTGFSVIDWSDPRNPELVTTVDVPGPEHSGVDVDESTDILGISNDAFKSPKVDSGAIGAQFYDISDPEDPERLGYFDVNPPEEQQLGAHNLFVRDGIAYLTRFFPRDDTALIAVDVGELDTGGDPDEARELDRWNIEETDITPEEGDSIDHRLNNPHQVYVEDGRAYIAHWDAGCQVLDVSGLESGGSVDEGDRMRRIGSFGETPEWRKAPETADEFKRRFSRPPGNVHSVRAFTIDGNTYAALGVETGQIVGGDYDTLGGVEIYDISDLSAPELIAGIAPPQVKRDDEFGKGGTAHNLDVQGDELHSAWYAGGVRVFDLSTPSDPVQIDRFDPEGTEVAYDTAVSAGRYTLATRRTESLVIIDTQPARTTNQPG